MCDIIGSAHHIFLHYIHSMSFTYFWGGLQDGVANEQVQKLGRALARQSGEDEDLTVCHLSQRLSLLLMRGNSSLLINRVPESNMDPEIAGYE